PQCQLEGQLGHPRGVPSRVWILGLERIGQAEQALQDRALEAAIGLLEVPRILQRLLIRLSQTLIGFAKLLFPGARSLVRLLEVAGVGDGLGKRYLAGHVGTSGTSERTSVSSARGEKGLVRYSSAPAARPRTRSSSWAAALSITIRVWAHSGARRSRRQTSSPPRCGIWTSRRTRSGGTALASSRAVTPSKAPTTWTWSSSSVNRTSSTIATSSSATRIVVMAVYTASMVPTAKACRINDLRSAGALGIVQRRFVSAQRTEQQPGDEILKEVHAPNSASLRPYGRVVGSAGSAEGPPGKPPPSLGVARDLEPREGPGQGRQRACVIDLLGWRCRALPRQSLLGSLLGALGTLPVDLLRPLGALGEDDHALTAHLGEAADHGEVLLLPAMAVGQLPGAER